MRVVVWSCQVSRGIIKPGRSVTTVKVKASFSRLAMRKNLTAEAFKLRRLVHALLILERISSEGTAPTSSLLTDTTLLSKSKGGALAVPIRSGDLRRTL